VTTPRTDAVPSDAVEGHRATPRQAPADGLDVRDLDVDLGGRPVLRDVDLAVPAGEFLGVLGPNGAGKTTLLRAVLGLVPVRSGTILVRGAPPTRDRSRLGYVPQRHEFAWDYPVSVLDAVLTGRSARLGVWRRPRTRDWEAAADAVDRVGLADLAARPVGELSGGQRQRVLVARALVADPEVLLLDEPYTGLDLPAQEELAALFTRLAAEGRAVVMTTHDLLGALHGCARLALVNGTVVAVGPGSALRDPLLWQRTFGVGPDSPLLRVLDGA
jgi:manganese/iron transport system ATP-binding protein